MAQGLAGVVNPQASQGFTGVVLVDGVKVQVVNGRAEYEGEVFIVSDDGQYVVDAEGRLAGVIQEGVFIQVSQELIDQLRQKGVFGEQPQGMAS